MSEELNSLRQKVDQHEREIIQIQTSTREMIDGQKLSTKAIQDLVATLERYMVKHDHVAQQSAELAKDVKELREQASANQVVIESVKGLGGKISGLLLTTILSPAALAALFAFGGK
ncbi:MAG: hypothetical protein [Podoviridae sp. ctKoA10]|jgi:chromosome segregation ATPase|nr:MAG: hypothetical protein [Podoviridae sp. ctKoA10]